MKYLFISDYDCHNFLIPLNLRDDFELMLEEANNSCDYEEFNKMFSRYMINGIEDYCFKEPELIEVDN